MKKRIALLCVVVFAMVSAACQKAPPPESPSNDESPTVTLIPARPTPIPKLQTELPPKPASPVQVVAAPTGMSRHRLFLKYVDGTVDDHPVIYVAVINEFEEFLDESLELHDFDSDGSIDVVSYINRIEKSRNKNWMAVWWRGPAAKAWFEKYQNVRLLGVDGNPGSSQVGSFDLNTMTLGKTLTLQAVSDDKVLGELFLAVDDLVSGFKQAHDAPGSKDPALLLGKGIGEVITFLDKRNEFPRYGAALRTNKQMEVPPTSEDVPGGRPSPQDLKSENTL
jgi:hypothetical protein